MDKLKILISHTSNYNKDSWGRVFPLAAGLAKNGNRVTIITTNENFSLFTKKKVIDNVNIIIFPEFIPSRISRMGFGFLSLFLKLLHIVFNKYDVVQSDNGHRPLSGMPCRWSKKLHKSVYVAEWYDWYGKGGQYDSKRKLFKILLGWYELKYEIEDKKVADGVVPLSEVLKERALQFKDEDEIKIVHGGAAIHTIPFIKENDHLKEKYGIEKEKITFGYINATSSNLEEFLPLINAIIKNGLQSKVKILLFGRSSRIESQMSEEMLSLVKRFGWIDFKKDYEKLQCVDVFFLLKQNTLLNRAGWPNNLGDCLACGRHVLLNPVGEVIPFVKKYPIAFFETNKEEDDIYEKILFIMNNRKDLVEKRSKIRFIAEKEISWDSKSEALIDFYNYLLGKKNK